MSLATFGKLTNGVLFLHPVFTVTQFDGQKLTDIEFPSQSLTIDGSKVTKCDSVGIAALLWLLQQAVSAQKSLTWQNLPTAITHLLNLYELDLVELTTYARTIN